MTPEERFRIALHEAGHALGFWLYFPGSLDAVSIRPGRSHLGFTLGSRGSADDALAAQIDGHHPLDGLDPVARQFADRVMIFTLLGIATEELLAPRIGRLPDRPTHPIPVLASSPPTPLAPETQKRLDEADAQTETVDDDERAFEQAFLLVGLTANAYLEWIRAEARRLAGDHAGPLYGLADTLLANEILGGGFAVELFDAHRRSTA